MSKRKKNKKRKQKAQNNPSPKKRQSSSSSPPETKRAYHTKRALELLAKNNIPNALQQLESAWPRQTEQFPAQRLQWLMAHWPSQAQREWSELSPAAWSTPTYTDFITQHILTFSSEEWEQIKSYNPPYLEEGQIVRDAFELLGQEKEEEARTALKAIGLRSPFRDVRMFLRGLGAYYNQRDEEAITAFQKLPQDSVYTNMSRSLLPYLYQEAAQNNPAVPQKFACFTPNEDAIKTIALWGEAQLTSLLQLQACVELIQNQKVNQALSHIRRQWESFDPHTQQLLYQELPGTLQASGMNPNALVKRMFQSIPPDPSDPKQDRLMGLLLQHSGELDLAEDHWDKWFDAWQKGKLHWPTPNRAITESLFHRHIARLNISMAKGIEGHDDEEFEWGYEYRRHTARGLWNQARDSLEEAVRLAPTLQASWVSLFNTLVDLGDHKEADRVLERAVKHIPNSSKLLVGAAQACDERKAYDKGLRFIRRALELNPLDVDCHILESRLLMHKARKKYHQDKPEQAIKLYQEVAANPHLPPRLSVQAKAEQTMVHLLGKQVKQAQQVWDSIDTLPWQARGYLCLAGEELAIPNSRKKKRKALDTSITNNLPTTPPTQEEIEALLHLYHDDRFPFYEPFGSDFITLLRYAFVEGYQYLSEHDDFDFAARVLVDPLVTLKVLEKAQETFPDCDHFAIDRYEKAIECDMPPTYFANAVSELEDYRDDDLSLDGASPFELISRIMSQVDEDDLDDFPFEMLSRPPTMNRRSSRIDALIEKIQKRIQPKKTTKKTTKKTRKRKR